jgi:hypothetical protein
MAACHAKSLYQVFKSVLQFFYPKGTEKHKEETNKLSWFYSIVNYPLSTVNCQLSIAPANAHVLSG